MKLNLKISGRERLVVALAPSIIVGAVYLFGFVGNLSDEVEKQQKRVEATSAPLAAQGASPTLVKAKVSLDEVKRNIADREGRIEKLQARIAELPRSGAIGDESGAARVIEKIEAIFARNGITPLISEGAGEGEGADRTPAALVSVLAPKSELDPSGRKSPRVWHYVFNDLTPRFQRALKEMSQDAPGVVALSCNLVYNPENDGATRLLELWLLY